MSEVLETPASRTAETVELETLPNSALVDEKVAARLATCSVSLLQKLRVRGGGPLFRRLPGTRLVRYEVGDVRAWRCAKPLSSTSELAA